MMIVKPPPELNAEKMFSLSPGTSMKPFESKKKVIVSSSSDEEMLSDNESEDEDLITMAQDISIPKTDEIIEEDLPSASESEEEVEFLDVEADLLSDGSDIELQEQGETVAEAPNARKPLASYDFKSKEGRFSEEFAYQNSRKKRLG